MRCSPCLVYPDDVISFGTTAPEALQRLEEVLERLSMFWATTEGNKVYFYANGSGVSGTHSWSNRPTLSSGKGVGVSGMACSLLGKAGATVYRIPRVLSSIHSELCRTLRTVGGFNPEGSFICVDYRTTSGI